MLSMVHIPTLGVILRELAEAREAEEIARIIGEHAPTLFGAKTATLVVGSRGVRDSSVDAAVAQSSVTVPVRRQDCVAAIRMEWPSTHVGTPEQLIVLRAIADAVALTIDNVRLSEAVRSAGALAEQSRRDSETLLATVAHELRQPLGAIVNAMALMQQRVDSEVGERARVIMARQVDQLRRMTDDLLDAVQVQRGTFTLDRVRLDAVGLVSDCVDAVRGRVDERHQRLTFSSSAPALWISGDAARVRQIASNLIDNAIKYTPIGGAIEVSVTADGSWVVIDVRDSGRGIDRMHLPHIFGLFFQEQSGAAGSLGIGLSVVKRLTEAHGGRFDARSEGVGLGSTFTVRLPADAVPTQPIAV